MLSGKFIELNRTFYKLSDYAESTADDDFDMQSLFRVKDGLTWENLLEHYRAIILSEAGSGKTEELSQITKKLINDEKPAFFLRLEDISDDFKNAFQVGAHKRFKKWLNSTEEGWIFLDSVDEARIRDPRDFERAIKKLSSKINNALSRTHIVITSRASAWRPHSDLQLCKTYLAYKTPYSVEKKSDKNSPEAQIAKKGSSQNIKLQLERNRKSNQEFDIYSFNDLKRGQIELFVKENEIKEVSRFLEDIERQDAWSFTTRPQDLEELIDFWKAHNRIGTRLELMKYNVERRLRERDQNRAEILPLNLDKSVAGARQLAAASVLTREATIKIPEGNSNANGLDVRDILKNWSDSECVAFLSRPLFDEAAYGTVRFHHRTVKEYLAAEWFVELLKKQGSRKRIEALIFQSSYGVEVIIPSIRPVLSWLVLFDEKIRQRAYEIEPEIFLEGGDPSKLNLDLRKKILKTVCLHLASKESSRSATSYAAVQRFANDDLTTEIGCLIKKYRKNYEIISFLLRMVWHAKISEALPEAKRYALNFSFEKYTQISAIRAVREIGTYSDYEGILTAFLDVKDKHDRTVMAEIVDGLTPDRSSIDWLIQALPKVKEIRNYDDAGLSEAIGKFADSIAVSLLSHFLVGIAKLLKRKPYLERSYCEISKKYGWLLVPTVNAIERLVVARHSSAFKGASLFSLQIIPIYSHYNEFEYRKLQDNKLPGLVPAWSELNSRLFWYSVNQTRKSLDKEEGERLIDCWHVESISGHYWLFDQDSFEYICGEIESRKFVDDKLVALSLAFRLYVENGRPRKWRESLKMLVSGAKELEEKLQFLLHPPAATKKDKAHRKQEAERKRKSQQQGNRRKKFHENWKIWLSDNSEHLRSNPRLKKGKCLHAYQYLLERMRKKSESSFRWADGNWEDLIEEYGVDVAEAFKDGAVKFWRYYSPELVSEIEDKNQVPLQIAFGLTGLYIESKSVEKWPQKLSKKEIQVACRYAFKEMNGFPDWFQQLYLKFSDLVFAMVLQEIKWELQNSIADENLHYLISRVVWNAKWLWEDLAPDFVKVLQKEPQNLQNLIDILNVIQKSSTVSDSKIAALASSKCIKIKSHDHLTVWYAVWMGVDPEKAFQSLSSFLDNLEQTEEATDFTIGFVVKLVGDGGSGSYTRQAFVNPEFLRKIYLFMFKYIRSEDDINRTGGGVYSPIQRDHAQEARSRLFTLLTNIPGKLAYLMLNDLAKNIPDRSMRPWILHIAQKRAEQDVEPSPYSTSAFNEFSAELEATPSNHKELYMLARWRLIDLKYDLEQGDSSNAAMLTRAKDEPEIRKYIGNWLRDRAASKYSIPQEEELADGKKPDFRLHGVGFDAPVPIELKIADNWTGTKLFERLRNQLCGDYLRDQRSNCGIFLLLHKGEKQKWRRKTGITIPNFQALVEALQAYWTRISKSYPNIDDINIIGISLEIRSKSKSKTNAKAKTMAKTKKRRRAKN